MRIMLKRVFFVSAVVAAVVTLMVYYSIRYVLPYSPIRPSRVVVRHDRAETLMTGLTCEPFDISVDDTIPLKGVFIHACTLPVRGTVVLLHGIASCKEGMAAKARLLAENGFNCIVYDSRAHGESGGIDCTFGYYEKKDVSAYLDSAAVRFPGSAPFGVYGHSMGAAVAVQALACDRRLVCGIVESPFAEMRETVHEYAAAMVGFHVDWIADAALNNAERIAHFSVDSVEPAASAQRIVQPVMVIHGLNDEKIPFVDGKTVYDRLRSEHKYWYPIAGGDHNHLRQIAGGEYDAKMIGFFTTYLR